MCQHCHTYPHLPGCPNAPEPKVIGVCKWCDEDIVEGETYANINGQMYHADCIEDMSAGKLAELFEFEILEAR